MPPCGVIGQDFTYPPLIYQGQRFTYQLAPNTLLKILHPEGCTRTDAFLGLASRRELYSESQIKYLPEKVLAFRDTHYKRA